MLSDALGGDFAYQQIVAGRIGREEAEISFIALVAGTSVGQMDKLLFHDSSTLTRISSSITSRGASVGQMPSRPRGSSIPPAPPINGGPLRASGGKSRPSFAASCLSAQRTAMRR